MSLLRVLPEDRIIAMHSGETVLQALKRAGIAISSECNGQGLCGKCTVLVEDPASVPPTPHPRIAAEDEAKGLRLACRIEPKQDLTITLQDIETEKEADADWILGSERFRLKRIHPAVSRTQEAHGPAAVIEGDPIGAPLPWPQDSPLLGAALDIGTSTLVVSIYDLESGHELGSARGLNPQRRYGSDVLSRIQKGSSPEGLRELSGLVRTRLNELLESACRQAGLFQDSLFEVTLGGNTTMLQLLAEIDPAPLGRSPFRHSLEGGRSYPAQDFGLAAHPQARVYLPPIIDAYAGTDISAGLLAVDFFAAGPPLLFMDIGTNGEMALRSEEGLLAASTAAGPAFEGGGLRSGMGAAEGAVEQVWLDKGRLRFSTLGNAPAKGICGSGLIDCIACLLRLGRLSPSGRLLRPDEGPDLPKGSRGEAIELEGSAAFRLQGDVLLTQQDIRSFQLAKSAVRTGLDLLLQRADLPPESLSALVLAGGFGRSLRPLNLEIVGILPGGTAGRLRFAGNTSLAGSAQLLLDTAARRRLEAAVPGIEYVRLAREDGFMDWFVENMEFPEPSLEPQVQAHATEES